METSYSQGLYELSHAYDGFILDQWGVLHHGQSAYDGAVTALNKLKAEKKQIVILSNSGKRAAFNKLRLQDFGITDKHYNEVITAGEVVWQGLSNRDDGVFKDLGSACYLINRGHDRSLLSGLDIDVVDTIDDADFILVTGIDSPAKTVEDYESDLKKAVARGIPLICANPDMITVFGKERQVGPGAVAQRFKEFGGVAHFIGKPHKTIFHQCITHFNGVIPSRILVVGDSLHHDIYGAQNCNLDSLFVMGGIHSAHFKKQGAESDKLRQVELLSQNYGVHPTWAMDRFIWQTPESARHEREREKWKE